jgi:hypothetical protein
MNMSTAPYLQDYTSMAPPAQTHEHHHEYKQDHEHEHHHGAVPFNNQDDEAEEVLLARIRAQVDFYFSPPNLAQDHFLCSLLTSHEHYGAVPVQQICGFPKIRQLVAMHANANMSMSAEDKAQLPPADPELLVRAIAQNKSDWVRAVGDAATGYWFVPFILPEQSLNHQYWHISSQDQQTHQQNQQTYLNRSQPHEQQQQQHARMVSGPPPPPPPSPPKKGQTSPTATAMTSSSTTESLSSSTSETVWPGTYQYIQQQHHPIVKERTVVLVHDIPDAHAEQDIWQLFSGSSIRQDDNNSTTSDDTTFQPKSVVQDMGRTWNITFGTEKEATAALLASRDKTYRDMPLRAGLKNDSTIPSHSNNNYGMQYSYQQQQQLQPYWQHTAPGNGQGESNHYMPVLPPMPYGTVQHQHAQHVHQQYSYGYAVMPPMIMSPSVMGPAMYASAGPSHQIGYAVPADYYPGNSHYQYAGAVPASPPPLPASSPPPQQVFVHSSQLSSNEEGDATAVVVEDYQEESTAQTKSSSQDTATTASVNGGGPHKNKSRAKKAPNNNSSNQGGQKYQRKGSNQSWSGDSQKEGDGQHPRQQHQGKGRNNGHKSKKSKGKQQPESAEASRILTEEHFPALGGSSKKKTYYVNSKPKKVAYAEALLKPPALVSVRSGEPTGQTRTNTKQHNVERRMKDLSLSEQGPSQLSSEQKA